MSQNDTLRHKLCAKCKLPKTEDQYASRKWSKDGLQHQCRSCCSVQQAAYRAARKLPGAA